MIEDSDPDPFLWLTDPFPGPGGLKTYGSFWSWSATLISIVILSFLCFVIWPPKQFEISKTKRIFESILKIGYFFITCLFQMVSEEVSQSIDMGLKALREGIFQTQVKFSEVFFMISLACLVWISWVSLQTSWSLSYSCKVHWRNLAHGTFFGIGSTPPPPPPGHLTSEDVQLSLPLSYSFFSRCDTQINAGGFSHIRQMDYERIFLQSFYGPHSFFFFW